jgi:hypothetical protein
MQADFVGQPRAGVVQVLQKTAQGFQLLIGRALA